MEKDTAESEFGACRCAAFVGHKAVHNWGQPGCKYEPKEERDPR